MFQETIKSLFSVRIKDQNWNRVDTEKKESMTFKIIRYQVKNELLFLDIYQESTMMKLWVISTFFFALFWII